MLALARRADHQTRRDLADRVGAQRDRSELEQLGLDVLREPAELEVTAAQAALADEPAGHARRDAVRVRPTR